MGINYGVKCRKRILSFLSNKFTIVFTSVMVFGNDRKSGRDSYFAVVPPFTAYNKPERW
jgi:hypothetical protein